MATPFRGRQSPAFICLLFLARWLVSTSALSRKQRYHPPPAGPLDGYYPDQVLCSGGKNPQGRERVYPWCIDWVQCIEKGAEPSGTSEAVLEAWGPATCQEICGVWPSKNKKLVQTTPVPTTTAAPTATAAVLSTTTAQITTTTSIAAPSKTPCPDWWDPADGDCTKVMEEIHEEEEEIHEEEEEIPEITTTAAAPSKAPCPEWWDPADGDCSRVMDEIQSEEEEILAEKDCPPWVDGDCSAIKDEMEFEYKPEHKFLQMTGNATSLSLLDTSKQSECLASCERFKTSFTTCVATIIFEPGKLVGMGLPQKGNLRKKVPEICTSRDTHCVPDLGVRYQKCAHHRTQSVLDPTYKVPDDVAQTCEFIAQDYDECKDCPQLSDDYLTQYAAFTGGCMEQMHAYRQSTMPFDTDAGTPRESGCKLQ